MPQVQRLDRIVMSIDAGRNAPSHAALSARQVAPEVVERRSSSCSTHDSKTAAPANLMSEAMNGLSVNESRFRLSTSGRWEFEQLSAACLMTSLKELIGPTLPLRDFNRSRLNGI